MNVACKGIDLIFILVGRGEELDVVYRDTVVEVELSFSECDFRFGETGVCKRRLLSCFHAHI